MCFSLFFFHDSQLTSHRKNDFVKTKEDVYPVKISKRFLCFSLLASFSSTKTPSTVTWSRLSLFSWSWSDCRRSTLSWSRRRSITCTSTSARARLEYRTKRHSGYQLHSDRVCSVRSGIVVEWCILDRLFSCGPLLPRHEYSILWNHAL